MSRRLYVYVAGPYSKGSVMENIRAAIDAGEFVLQRGHIPFIPHMNYAWCLIHPKETQAWYDWDNDWLVKCDLVLRLPGESPGSDKEVKLAESRGIPVVYGLGAFVDYLEGK